MSDLDEFYAQTGASPDAATRAGGGGIPLPLKKSTCINLALYNPFSGELNIIFQDGTQATFATDLITILGWFKADSIGSYFNQQIKNR